MYISHQFPLLQYVSLVTLCVCGLVGLSFMIDVARFVSRVHVSKLPYGRYCACRVCTLPLRESWHLSCVLSPQQKTTNKWDFDDNMYTTTCITGC
jgi:hypothetical protein